MGVREELRELIGVDSDRVRRFVEKVSEEPDENGCWLWIGGKSRNRSNLRYGSFNGMRAHRLIYEWVVGFIPDGMVILHTCDVPHCVNPNHLRLGTQADNVRDMIEKGRKVTKTQKLNPEAVSDIRRRYQQGETQAVIAKDYNIHSSQVSKIVNRVWWKHVA